MAATPGRARWRDAASAQTVLLWRSRRPWLLLVFVAGIWAVYLLQILGDPWSADRLVSPGWAGLSFAVGAVWGTQLWNDEPPRARLYHWSLPLDTTANDLARLAAGALWLLLGVMAFLTIGFGFMLAFDDLTVIREVNPLLWLSFATSALIGYLLAATLAAFTGKALEIALLISIVTLVAVFELVMEGRAVGWLAPVGQVLSAVFTDRGGLLTAVAGMAARSSVTLGGAEAQSPWISVSTTAWLQAVVLWLVAGGSAYVLASSWHRRR